MLLERLGKELLYFDGGMGTLLQSRGLKPGIWNIQKQSLISTDNILRREVTLSCLIHLVQMQSNFMIQNIS